MDKKNNDELLYVGEITEEFEADSDLRKEKKLHDKFIASEEDDALSENWSEDQEEQNEIHSNLFDNQPSEKKRDITPPKH